MPVTRCARSSSAVPKGYFFNDSSCVRRPDAMASLSALIGCLGETSIINIDD